MICSTSKGEGAVHWLDPGLFLKDFLFILVSCLIFFKCGEYLMMMCWLSVISSSYTVPFYANFWHRFSSAPIQISISTVFVSYCVETAYRCTKNTALMKTLLCGNALAIHVTIKYFQYDFDWLGCICFDCFHFLFELFGGRIIVAKLTLDYTLP